VSQFVTDTHPLIWHLTGDARLTADARRVFAGADLGMHRVWVPGIVLIEMVYLTEKGIVPQSMLERALTLLDTPDGSYAVPALDQAVARSMLQQVPWKMIPELADRIIVASALVLGLPLISKDERIRISGLVPFIW
jgi:PIN domain nuclease of toxin-antitoxin system